MSALTDNTVDLFGKTVDDLQTSVSISDGVASGTLKHVADYTDAGFDMTEGTNFIVLKATTDEGTTTTATMEDRTVTLDSDGILIFQMTDAKKAKKLVFETTDGNETTTKEIALTGLTLQGE